MSQFNVLMLSSSKVGNGGYLSDAKLSILTHLNGITDVTFIPYAGVSMTYDDYTQAVADALPMLNIKGIHTFEQPQEALASSNAILVGGGNTFALLDMLYKTALLAPLQQRLAQGLPYIGWSAGANICGATLRTTNDMPIVEPPSFNALSVVPFQLNPHYTDFVAPGHNGETREQRIQEFTQLNPTTPVVGIQEGSALLLKGQTLTLEGNLPAFVFLADKKTQIEQGTDLSHLLT